MHFDWQDIATFAIVAAAGAAVARRVWGQIAAFRAAAPKDALDGEISACSGCGGGCGIAMTVAETRVRPEPQLVNISLNAPERIRPVRSSSGAQSRN